MLTREDIQSIASRASATASRYITEAMGLGNQGPKTEDEAEAYSWAVIATVSFLMSILLVQRSLESKQAIVRLLLANVAAFTKGVEDQLEKEETAAKKGQTDAGLQSSAQ